MTLDLDQGRKLRSWSLYLCFKCFCSRKRHFSGNLIYNPASDEVYSIKHYAIKFISDLEQIDVFLRFPPLIKLTSTILLN